MNRYLSVGHAKTHGTPTSPTFCNPISDFGILATALGQQPSGAVRYLRFEDQDLLARSLRVREPGVVATWRAGLEDFGMLSDVLEDAGNGHDDLRVMVVEMSQKDYDALDEFEGFRRS